MTQGSENKSASTDNEQVTSANNATQNAVQDSPNPSVLPPEHAPHDIVTLAPSDFLEDDVANASPSCANADVSGGYEPPSTSDPASVQVGHTCAPSPDGDGPRKLLLDQTRDGGGHCGGVATSTSAEGMALPANTGQQYWDLPRTCVLLGAAAEQRGSPTGEE